MWLLTLGERNCLTLPGKAFPSPPRGPPPLWSLQHPCPPQRRHDPLWLSPGGGPAQPLCLPEEARRSTQSASQEFAHPTEGAKSSLASRQGAKVVPEGPKTSAAAAAPVELLPGVAKLLFLVLMKYSGIKALFTIFLKMLISQQEFVTM